MVTKFRIVMLVLLLGWMGSSCEKPVVEKPKDLVSKDKMIDMLTDIHISESMYQTRRYTSQDMRKITEADLYYSVLKKYDVADSTFERSLIYYSSLPKEYERIYSRVLNKLNEMEQEINKQKQQPVDINVQ
jgi:hypothetical protein